MIGNQTKKMSVESQKDHAQDEDNDRPSSPQLIDPTRERESLGEILQALNGSNDSDTVKPIDVPEVPEKVSLDSIVQEFDRNHCFPTVLLNTNDRATDIARYHLYLEALLPSNAGVNYESRLARLNTPRFSVEDLIKTSLEARDITKEHLIASFETARRLWKLTFSKKTNLVLSAETYKDHFNALDAKQLKALYTQVQLFLGIIDSLIVIVKRQSEHYPNQELVTPTSTPQNTQEQLSSAEQQLPATGEMPVEAALPEKKVVTWKTITEALNKKITPTTLPLAKTVNGQELERGVITQGHEEREKSNWSLEVTLLSNHYHQFCNRVLSEPLPEVLELINTLSQVTIGTARGTALLEKLETIFKKQVKECAAKEAQVSDALLPEIFDFAYRVLEMSSSLKVLVDRNTDKPVVQKKSLFQKLMSLGENVKKKWNGWFSKEKTPAEKPSLKSKPKRGKSRMMWLAAGFASLFLGNTRTHQSDTASAESIPITEVRPLQEREQTTSTNNSTNTLETEKEANTLTGNTAAGLENNHNASVQRGLQDAFKKPNAIGVFQQILGSELSPTPEQHRYLANTFAGIIRPHLHHFHTGRLAGEMRVVYQGRAPHHKHIFKVVYGDRTETVSIHIPSWNDLSRGLANALNPSPAHVSNNSVRIQNPQVATPPAPTSDITKSTKPTDAEISTALDALSQADQTPRTNTAPVRSAPSEVDLALEELAQSDRNKNQSA